MRTFFKEGGETDPEPSLASHSKEQLAPTDILRQVTGPINSGVTGKLQIDDSLLSQASSLPVEEDLGICVEAPRKPKKNRQLTSQWDNSRNLKRKFPEQNSNRKKDVQQNQLVNHSDVYHVDHECVPMKINVQSGTSKEGKYIKHGIRTCAVVASACSENSKNLGVVVGTGTTTGKRKRAGEQYQGNKAVKSKENNCNVSTTVTITPEFMKHYKKVQKRVKNINSVQDFENFLNLEKKKRKKKPCGIASSLMTENEWKMVSQLVSRRIRKTKKVSCKNPSNGHNSVPQIVCKTKIRLKFWLLYPHLKGKKPYNWKNILSHMKECKKKADSTM